MTMDRKDDDGSMVDRVARAIAKVSGWSDWWDYRDEARAAIEAMREPDDAMVEAGNDNIAGQEDVRYVFVAMLDAALAEAGEGR